MQVSTLNESVIIYGIIETPGNDSVRTATVVLRDGRVEIAFGKAWASGSLGIIAEDLADAAMAQLVEAPPGPRFGPDRLAWQENQKQVAGLGAELAQALLGDRALADVGALLAERPPQRIRIVSDDPRLLAAPWELVRLDAGTSARVLAQSCEIVRVPLEAEEILPVTMTPHSGRHGHELRVAIISPRPAGPRDVPVHPALGPVLGTALGSSDRVRLRVVRPRTLESLEAVLADEGPFDVVHFDGHGRTRAVGGTELIFEDEDGCERPVEVEPFAAAVAVADPWLVLLNACRSAAIGVGPAAAPSFAATLCRRLPRTRVIAMRYAVSVDFVEALVSSLYPLLVAGVGVGEAVRRTNAKLAETWRADADAAPPLFVNLTSWQSPSSCESDDGVAVATDVPSIDWRSSAPILFWAEEIEELQQALDTTRVTVAARTLGSATSEIVDLFVQYATETGLFARSVLGLGAEADDAPDMTLHVVSVDQADDLAEAARACEGLIAGKPRSSAIVLVTDGRPQQGMVHVGDWEVPVALIGTRLLSVLDGRNPFENDEESGRAWEMLTACQDDYATLTAISSCESFAEAAALLERVRWGVRLDGFAGAAALREARARLEPEQAKLVSLLGLAGGGLIYQELMTLVTTGGVKSETFIEVLGRHVHADEWEDAVQAAAAVGLLRLIENLAPRPTAMITSLQALCMREMLAEWASEQQASALQRTFATSSIAFSIGFHDTFTQGSTGVYTSFLAICEGLLARAIEVGLRDRDDDLTMRALHQLVGRPLGELQSLSARLQGCDALKAIYGFEDLPGAESALLGWHAWDAMDRELWQDALVLVEAALAVQGASRRYMTEAHLHLMRSRALWRTGRTTEAEEALAKAARLADDTEARAVASACADLAQYLQLGAQERERMRQRVGAPREAPSLMRKAITAEAERRYGDAYALWVAYLGECQTNGTAASRAFALAELGRFCAMYGSHEDAEYWLRRRLELGARLGLDQEQPLRMLGVSAERAERLGEARSWLNDAILAARRSGARRAEAECLYELAIVAAKADDSGSGAGRRELLVAAETFELVGPRLHAGDCFLLLAQIEAAAGEHAAAADAVTRFTTIYRECAADQERLDRAQDAIAVLGDW